MRGRGRPVFPEVAALDVREIAAQRVLLRETRIFEPLFNVYQLLDRGRLASFGGHLPGEVDEKAEAILDIRSLRSIQEPVPVEIGERDKQGHDRAYDNGSRRLSGSNLLA